MASLSFNTTLNPNIFLFNPSKPTISIKIPTTHLTKLKENDINHQISYKSYFNLISSLCKNSRLQEAVDLCIEMESQYLFIGPDIYGELLQGCLYEQDLCLGQQIHAKIVKYGDLFAKNDYLETKLVIFYAKCDLFYVATNLFHGLHNQNVFSWTAIIGMYCRNGFCKEALLSFCEMLEHGFEADNFAAPNVLKSCGALQYIGLGKSVHGYVLKMNLQGCVFVASSLVDMYGKCGALVNARRVFDHMCDRNTVAWNSMIVSYVQNGMDEEAMGIFYDTRMQDIEPSRVTLSSFLSASANLWALEEGKQGHAIAILNGLNLDKIVGSSIINFYSKVGLVEDAELVFSRMLERDMVTWNLLLSCYLQNGYVERALRLCSLMRSEGCRFDSVTLISILSSSAYTGNLILGKAAHCYCIRHNFVFYVAVASAIINMYAKQRKINSARGVFNYTKEKDLVLWNSLLATYAEMGLSGETLKLFCRMQLESVPPNVISWNSVILGFLRNGQVIEALDIFSQMQSVEMQPNLITYTTLINGLAQNEYGYEAITLLRQMQEEGIQPNVVSIIGTLLACTEIASLQYGRAVHCFILRQAIPFSVSVTTALVDMYAKCGNIDQARKVFDMILVKELALYNAMITGYALHGCPGEALTLLNDMWENGITPDGITFTSVLSSCRHAGLVKEGLKIFVDMISLHNVQPTVEHYGCLVSLLSRCGNMHEAVEIVLSMPFDPDLHLFASLVAACRKHNEIKLAEELSKCLIKMEPYNSGNYVTLSNAYAAAGKWDEVSQLRDLMKEKGLMKSPGCSWIQIGTEVHLFLAGDTSHSENEKIYATLDLLGMEMQ